MHILTLIVILIVGIYKAPKGHKMHTSRVKVRI